MILLQVSTLQGCSCYYCRGVSSRSKQRNDIRDTFAHLYIARVTSLFF